MPFWIAQSQKQSPLHFRSTLKFKLFQSLPDFESCVCLAMKVNCNLICFNSACETAKNFASLLILTFKAQLEIWRKKIMLGLQCVKLVRSLISRLCRISRHSFSTKLLCFTLNSSKRLSVMSVILVTSCFRNLENKLENRIYLEDFFAIECQCSRLCKCVTQFSWREV